MSRFQDYLSSAITPQMTLLEKFNALIKFLKENNFISVFYSSQNYNPTILNYNISDVSTLGFELKLGDCIIFSNGYYAFVETIGENSFTIGNILYFQGEQGVSVVSASINSTGDLVLNLSNGTTINAGNTGAVKDFIIDGSQHLIVRYLNGTQNDLGAIFNGNVNISGDFTADSIIENMSGYDYYLITKKDYITPVYVSASKNGNKLTLVACASITLQEGDTFSRYSNLWEFDFIIPASVGSKIYGLVISRLDQKTIKVFSNTFLDYFEFVVNFSKTDNTHLDMSIYGTDEANTGMVRGRTYAFRIEETFLLSDSFTE